MSNNHSWIIGATADCQVVVDAPTVSSRHCRLTRSGNGLVLEDLGSTNGTFVNGRRVLDAARVSRGDQIGLGSDVVLDVEFLFDKLTRSAPVSPLRWSVTQLGLKPVLAVAALLTVMFLSVAFAQFGRSSAKGASSVAVDTTNKIRATEPATLKSHPTESTEPFGKTEAIASYNSESDRKNPPAATPPTPAIAPSSADSQAVTSSTAVPVDPRRAVYSVLAQDAETGKTFAVGTAWAASKQHLVTSGVVVQRLEENRAHISAMSVRCDADGKQFSIRRTSVHPEFQRLFAQARQAESALKARTKQLDDLRRESDPSQAASEKLIDEAVAFRLQQFDAIEHSVFYDIGVLQIDGPLTICLPMAPRDASLKLPASLLGSVSAMTETEASVESLSSIPHACELIATPQWTESDQPVRGLQFKCMPDQRERDWTGSPVLDNHGRVLALFARITPAAASSGTPSGNRFDAVAISQLQPLLPELFAEEK